MKKKDLNEKEIIEALELIKFDYQKHHSLKAALYDFFKEEKYDKVMRGIVTNKEDLLTVKKVTKTYQLLKKYEEEILSGKFIKKEPNVIEIEDSKSKLDEFIFLNGKVYKKNEMDKYVEQKYDEIVNSSSDYKPFDDNYDIFYDGKCNLINLHGKLIYSVREKKYDIKRVSSNVLYIKLEHGNQKEERVYVGIDGTILFDLDTDDNDYDDIQLKNIISVLDYYFDKPNLLEKFFLVLKNNNNLDYLNEKILSIKDNFICTKNNIESVSYYDYQGKRIISSDLDVLCYIDDKINQASDNRNIIVIGKLNNKLERLYGYYDLDNQCLFGKLEKYVPGPWLGYLSFEKLRWDWRYEKEIKVWNQEGDSYLESPRFFIDFMKKEGTVSIGTENFVFQSLHLIKDDLYYAIYEHKFYKPKYPVIDYSKVENDYYRVLVQYKNGKYTKISDPIEEKFFVIHSMEPIQIFAGEKFFYVDDNKKICCTNTLQNKTKLKYLSLEAQSPKFLALNASEFLLTGYQELAKIETTELAIKKKNELITSSRENEQKKGNFVIQPVFFTDKDEIRTLKNCYDGISHVESFGKDSIYLSPTNYFAISSNFDADIKSIDPNKRMILRVGYRTNSSQFFTRNILIDMNGNILIGYSLNIDYKNGYYIVKTLDQTMQLYDVNAIPVTGACDKIYFVEKMYVNKNGNIEKKEPRLVIENLGYTYLIDGKDYIISENTVYSSIINEVNDLFDESVIDEVNNLVLDENSSKKNGKTRTLDKRRS